MLARFHGGPHEGFELDYELLMQHFLVRVFDSPEGPVLFVFLPPSEESLERQISEGAESPGEDDLVVYYQVGDSGGVEFRFDENRRRLEELGGDELQMPAFADSSDGAYYKCLRGDSEHLALAERDSFIVQDVRGRNWVCYPIAQRKVENLSILAHLSDVLEIDAASRRLGLGEHGTEVRIYFCQDESELQERLAVDPPPKGTKPSV